MSELKKAERRLTGMFVAPCMVVLLFIVVFPLGYNLFLSMHDWNLVHSDEVKFIGFQNFAGIVKSQIFWGTLWTTFVFSGSALVIEFFLAFAIALFLNQRFPGKGFVQTCLMLPMVATPVAVSYIWRIMYNPDFGVINYALRSLGLPIWKGIFSDKTAMASLVIVDVWQWTPFLTMIFTAALLSMPREPLEAADVDGASWFQKLIHVTVPLIRNIMLIGLVLRGIDLFKTFDIIYSLTGGGPGRLTETLNIYTYNMIFQNLEVGYAAALSVFALIIASIVLMRVAKSTKLGG